VLETVRDGVPLVALLVLLAVAYLHPREWVEAAVAVGCGVAALATGTLDEAGLRAETGRLLPVVAFLMAILVVAECCRAAGLFTALGARAASAGSHRRIFAVVFVVATAITVVLSLDATVVLLTPVVLVAAATTRVSSRPLQLVCVRLANSASLLLPVSNLTNLLAMPRLQLSFGRFALLMAPVWLLTLAVEYAGHRAWFRSELGRPATRPDQADVPHLPRVPLVVVGLMLAGFVAGSALGVEPAWIAAAAALALGLRAVLRREAGVRRLLHSTHASFALFVLGLGLVVATLGEGPLGRHLADWAPGGSGLGSLLALAALGAVLANLVNNLPATLLLLPLAAPAGTLAGLAALVGINLGSSMTWSGSLANLLWRRTVLHHGGTVSSRDFHMVALLVSPVAIVLGVVVLDLWGHLI
jgi:arsenical pump membrane protein